MNFPPIEFNALAPTIVLSISALLVLMFGLFDATRGRSFLTAAAAIAVAVAAVTSIAASSPVAWNSFGIPTAGTTPGVLINDGFALYAGLTILIATGATILISGRYLADEPTYSGEYLALILFAAAGMSLVVAAADLIILLLGIEILSIALYVLSGFSRSRETSQESALKYFLLGAFSLSFMIYGAALLFGAAQSTRLSTIATVIAANARPNLTDNMLVLGGVALILVGFAFKLSLAPFHMWTPDTYQGAPTPISGFMSVATKAAIFVALLRFLAFAVPALRAEWSIAVAVLIILTLLVGNTAAIAQTRVKRLLAYSSIAQAGYIAIGILAGAAAGGAILFYLLAYTLANLGAFAALSALGEGDSDPEVDDLKGLGARSPLLAGAIAIFMLGLAGIPLTAGFMGKLFVFIAGIQAGYVDLVILAAITSIAATFYYLRVIIAMYFQPVSASPIRVEMNGATVAVLALLAVGTVALGILPAGALVG